MAVALALRLWAVQAAGFDPYAPGRFDDSGFYQETARSLALGRGYITPWFGNATAGWPPGYSFFLAGFYKLFSPDPLIAGLLNAGLATLTAAGVYVIGAVAAGRWSGAVAGLTFAVFPGQVLFVPLTMSEVLFTAGLVFACLLAVAWRGWSGTAGALVAGLLVGALALVRGQALVLPAVFAALLWLTGIHWRNAATWGLVVAGVAFLVLVPWALRNQRELGSFVLVSTSTSSNLWFGHHEGATGGVSVAYPTSFDDLPLDRQEVAQANAMFKDGVRFMFTHPEEELRLSLSKIRRLWQGDSDGVFWLDAGGKDPKFSAAKRAALVRLSDSYYFTVLALGVMGIVLGLIRQNRTAFLLAFLLVAWTAGHVLFWADTRFHFPVVFVFCVGAGMLPALLFGTRARAGGDGIDFVPDAACGAHPQA